MNKLFKHIMQPCRHKGDKGFTMIELLIVIAVLGVLAGVAVPNVTGFMTSGRVAAGNAELASIQTAVQAYVAEHSGSIGAATTINTAAGTDLDISDYMAGNIKYAYTVVVASGVVTITGEPTVAGLVGGVKASDDGLAWSGGQWTRA